MSVELVKHYLDKNWSLVFWPANGDDKGPSDKASKGWTSRVYTLADYHEGDRVGVKTGTLIAPDRYLHDVDIDWGAGWPVAAKILPVTDFAFGHASKKFSHGFYTCSVALASYRYNDIDDTSLIELRGTKTNGEVGCQTMIPPSIWSKEGHSEPLKFVRKGDPSHVDAALLKNRVCLAAIAMLLSKHLGTNGFGHETRLAWAGHFLRLGVPADDLIVMGEAMSVATNNTEVADVRLVVETTAARMSHAQQKIKGGPSLAKLLGDRGKKILGRIAEWLGRDSDFIRNADGKIVRDHQENVRRALVLLGVELSFNEFAHKMLLTYEDGRTVLVEDRVVNELYLRIDAEFHFRPALQFFQMVVENLAWEAQFHPVKQYLDTLVWDGSPRLEHWLIDGAGAEDTEFIRVVSRLVLIAAVRRVKHPGCKFDEILVLESKQGLEKSTLLRTLCPDDAWFSDDLPLNLKSQQMIESTLGKWILEAADLAGKRKTEIEQLKAMLSRQVDGPARMAYAHFPVERARSFIIFGTTNSADYLNDQTGARRFWPVRIRRGNIAWMRTWRDQLWAEAVAREGAGESIRLPESLWAMAGEEQEERREVDAWEEQIGQLVEGWECASTGEKRIPTARIWECVMVAIDRRDRTGALRISEIMQRLGFTRTKIRDDEGKMVAGYVGAIEKLPLESRKDTEV